MVTWANIEDPDEMPQNVAFHQGLQFAKIKSFLGTNRHHHLEILICDLLICSMNHLKYLLLNIDKKHQYIKS